MNPEEMGRIYKVLAFSNDSQSTTSVRPVGFENM
jgi:hypothetical protein